MEMNNETFTAHVKESTTIGKPLPTVDNVKIAVAETKYAYGAMELPREYISDYEEYKNVLVKCNTTLHSTTYPSDGECILIHFRAFSCKLCHLMTVFFSFLFRCLL